MSEVKQYNIKNGKLIQESIMVPNQVGGVKQNEINGVKEIGPKSFPMFLHKPTDPRTISSSATHPTPLSPPHHFTNL